MNRQISLLRHYIAAGFLIFGVILLTYASTRVSTTQMALTKAKRVTEEYLEKQNLVYGEGNSSIVIGEETQLESRQLLGRIGDIGGMYYWWNDAIPYLGAGVLLVAIGSLVPFCQARVPKNPQVNIC